MIVFCSRAEIVLSEILPRSQNLFRGCGLSLDFLERWNNDAADVNRRIRALGREVDMTKGRGIFY